jgi:hypothetical protein
MAQPVIATPLNPRTSAQAGSEPLTHIVRQATEDTDRYQSLHQTHEQTRSGQPTGAGSVEQDSGGIFDRPRSGTAGDVGPGQRQPTPGADHGEARIDDGSASLPSTTAPPPDLGGSSGIPPAWTVPQPRHPAVPHDPDSGTDRAAASQSTEPPVDVPSHPAASDPTARLAPTTASTTPRLPTPAADGGHESSAHGLSGGLATHLVAPDATAVGADPTAHHGNDHLAAHH